MYRAMRGMMHRMMMHRVMMMYRAMMYGRPVMVLRHSKAAHADKNQGSQ
jgi:hypothetical protein